MIPSKRRGQRGMSMMEVLVAMLIFTVVFLVALGLYQVANRAYLRTDAATIQQQNVRFAMDRMAETLRDSGANYNTLGANNVADEQIEGAWESAVFVRGDFNNKRETALESTTFPIVTTSNSEIVGYVLRKPGGDANNTVSLTLHMDTSTPRDATLTGTTLANEETVTVKAAAQDLAGQTNPPYQLARVTFDSTGAPQYEVIAEDVFRLSFSYLDGTGAAAITTQGGGDTERAQRAAVRQIDVNLIGQSSRPDPGYTDPNTYTPAEGTATKNLRKLSLTQHIVPPNLGLKGKRHSSLPAITIAAPASITVCTGHSQYFGVSWPASASAGVTTYKVHITAPAAGPDPAYVSIPDQTVVGLAFDFHQPTTTARAYTFSVAATAAGQDSAYTAGVTATQSENSASVPSAPTGTIASQDASGAYTTLVNWTAVTTNTGPITASTCTTSGGGSSAPSSPWNITPIDLSYYKVYRVRSDGVNTGAFTTTPLTTPNRVDTQAIGTLVNTTPSGAYSAGNNSLAAFIDHTAAPCTAYFYREEAFDYADTRSASSPAMAAAFSYDIQPATIVPDAPGGVNRAAAVTGTTTSSAGNYNVTINWPAVIQTSTGSPAATAHYQVDRYKKVAPAGTFSLDQANIDVYETTTWSDVVPTTVSGNAATYQYYVRAVYDCATSRSSLQAGPYTATCTPAGSMSITVPTSGADVTRPSITALVPQLTVTGSGWTSATVSITGPSGSIVYSQTINASPVGSTYTFPTFDMANTSTYPDGTYTLSATASTGVCTTPVQTRTFTASTVVCGLQLAATPSYTGNGANVFTGLTFQIQNTCAANGFTVNSLKFTWSGVLAGRFITSIKVGATTVASGLTAATGGNGVAITLSPVQTIAAGATSSTVTLAFSSNFTSDGTKNGTGGKFSSIIAHETLPAAANDELINGSPVP